MGAQIVNIHENIIKHFKTQKIVLGHKYEYLIIAWVRVRVRVLVDEYEYKEYEYILYKQQYCIFQSLKRESSHFYNPGTKLQLPIVHVNSLCQYISQK